MWWRLGKLRSEDAGLVAIIISFIASLWILVMVTLTGL